MTNPGKMRRWERMPVRVVTSKGFSTAVVEERGSELSAGGMTLHAGILLNAGDLLELEFETPTLSRVPGYRSVAQRLLLRPRIHHAAACLSFAASH